MKCAVTALLVALLTVIAAQQVLGANGQQLLLPQGLPPRTIPPWEFEVDASGCDGEAFRGVHVRVIRPAILGPTTRKHTLRIQLSVRGRGQMNYDERVVDTIEVPEGVQSHQHTVIVPQRQEIWSIDVKIFEDGSLLRGCENTLVPSMVGFRSRSDGSASVLVIDFDAPTRDEYRQLLGNIASAQSPRKDKHELPDVRWLLAAIPINQQQSNGQTFAYTQEGFDDAQHLQAFANHDGIDLIPPQELSERWLAQSNAAVVVISRSDWHRLREQHAAHHEMLLRWLNAGGTLVVYEAGDRWQHIDAIEQLAGLRSDGKKPGESTRWTMPAKEKFVPQVQGVDINGSGGMYYPSSDSTPTASPWTDAPFALQRVGLGMLVVYRNNPFPGVPEDWGGFWNNVTTRQFLWTQRHGMSHVRQNRDFWNFVIPGVGEAPVFSFMGMIAVFMLLIGPANYYYLNRWRRLSLLLFTVPLGATIFTVGLFAFAIISDGFSTRSRVRSYTTLERDGHAASMSRQTYYTAFVPSDGMRYPVDTAVYPLHPQPYNEIGDALHMSDSRWNGDDLQLERRYLTARQHRQFMIVRSTKSPASLEARAAGEALRVKNRLGVPIRFCVLRTPDGLLYRVENLPVDEIGTAAQVSPKEASQAWHKLLEPHSLHLPSGFDPDLYESSFSRRRYYYGGNSESSSNSALEQGIQRCGLAMADPSALKVGDDAWFVAITSEPIADEQGTSLVPMGVQGSRVVDALHVVRGKW